MLGLQTSLESAEDSAEGVYKIFLLVVDLSENAVSTYTVNWENFVIKKFL